MPPTLSLDPSIALDTAQDLDLKDVDSHVPEHPDDYLDLELDPELEREAAAIPATEAWLAAGDKTALPFAVDWRGRTIAGVGLDRQKARYGRFPAGLPSGLCLHYPVANVWVKKTAGPDRLRKGVDLKVVDGVAYARRHGLTYHIIDYLGRIHQDCDIDARGVHGDGANRYTQGVEVTSAGRLRQVGAGFYRTFDVDGHGQLKNPNQPSFPGWARRTVEERLVNISPGTYALYTPAQVRGIFRLHAGLMYCDRGRGIYWSRHHPDAPKSGVTSHDVHQPLKRDAGGSLFVDIVAFGELLERFVARVRAEGVDHAVFADIEVVDRAFEAVVLADPRYQRTYEAWDDQALPI